MRTRLNRITLFVAAILLLLCAACAGQSGELSGLRGSDKPQAQAPSQSELENLLMQEFARLGIDPNKVSSTAPSGPANRVFDLAGTVVDPDGTLGPLPPTGVDLGWTELANGDYDENGIVAVNDLTPIGQFFQSDIAYDDASLHGGFPAWPTGDPEDDGGAADDQPPADPSGARNWRLSRVDGNLDGVISVQDLTNIAVHFGEKVNGYRVYRKAPGDPDFVLRANPSDGSSPLTIDRVSPGLLDSRRPIRYHFIDDLSDLTLVDGDQIQYYIAPYDISGANEGQSSITLTMSIGTVNNNPPVADIQPSATTVNVNEDVTFDASGSTDDFGIVKYEWDLDGNGSFETDTGATPNVTTSYALPDPQTINLRVTDGGGLTDTDFTNITVINPAGHVISGHVLTDAAAPLGGVVMTLNPGNVVTQSVADGSYAFNDLPDGDYTVTPALAGYTFTPNPANVTLAGTDQTSVDFTANQITGPTHSIAGTVTRLNADWPNPFDGNPPDEPFPGVTVQCWENDGDFLPATLITTAETDSNGAYLLESVPESSFGITVYCDPADVVEIFLPIGGQRADYGFNSDKTLWDFVDKNNHLVGGA